MRNPAKSVLALVYLGIFTFIVCALYFVVSTKLGLVGVPFLANLWQKNGGLQQGDNGTTFSDYVVEDNDLRAEEVVGGGPSDSMRRSFAFVSSNRRSEPSLRPVLGEGEILIEVSEVNGAKVYKLLVSNDPQFESIAGEEVSFNPVISAQNLIVQDRDDGQVFYYSYELDGFTFPDSLKAGDKVVFKCSVSGCSDNSLGWAFVFHTYE